MFSPDEKNYVLGYLLVGLPDENSTALPIVFDTEDIATYQTLGLRNRILSGDQLLDSPHFYHKYSYLYARATRPARHLLTMSMNNNFAIDQVIISQLDLLDLSAFDYLFIKKVHESRSNPEMDCTKSVIDSYVRSSRCNCPPDVMLNCQDLRIVITLKDLTPTYLMDYVAHYAAYVGRYI